MAAIRILHVIDHLGTGGGQQIVLDYLRYSPQGEFDYTVAYFFGRHHFRAEMEAHGARVEYLGLGRYNKVTALLQMLNPFAYYRFYKLMSRGGFQVMQIHLYYCYVVALVCVWCSRTLGRKTPRVIYTMHAMKNQVPDFFPVFRLFAKIPDVIGVDIPETVQEMAESGVRGRRVIPIMESTDKYKEPPTDPSTLRHELGIGNDEPVILTLGRLHKQKGEAFVMAALPFILKQIPNVRYVCVGDGEEEQNLRAQARELGVQDQVIFAGFRRDVTRFFDLCDVFMHPATHEAIGLTILDVLARGKPVIGFNSGGLYLAVKNGETGFLVNRGDIAALAEKTILCLKDQALRQRLGEQGVALMKKEFALDAFVNEYFKLYRELALV